MRTYNTTLMEMPALEETHGGYRKIKMRRALHAFKGLMDAEIVLVHMPDNEVTPFATWQRNLQDGGTYWGHYFGPDEGDEAVKDFMTRGR